MGEFKERFEKYYDYTPSLTPPFPKAMLLETTNHCNHSCIFCSHLKMSRPRGFIKKELAFRLLKEAYILGVREVGFYMFGEPLLDPNLEQYIRYAKELGFVYTFLTTNGSLLNEERMLSVIDSGLDSIKFSLNGATREHYLFAHGVDDFEEVKKNIIRISDYREQTNKNFRIFISSVITKYTQGDGDIIRSLFMPYVDEVFVVECHNQGGNMNYEMENALKISKNKNVHSEKGFCFMPFNRIHITYEGYLTLCCVDYQNYLAIENLNEISLNEAWYSLKFQKVRQMHMDDRLEGTLCYNCLKNVVSEIKPLSEMYCPYYSDKEKQMQVLQMRLSKLNESRF